MTIYPAHRVFGGESRYLTYYLTHFYQVSIPPEVVSDYSKELKKWLEGKQTHAKEGRLYRVLQELEEYMYGENPPKESVQRCYRYLTNRLEQLDYLEVIMEDLPIGSK